VCAAEKEILFKKIKELEEENLRLKLELKEFRERYWLKTKKKEDPTQAEAETPKKRGAPIGHSGWYRKKPDHIDETLDVTLHECPGCGSTNLTECVEVEEHTQEDIIIPQVQVTLYRKRVYWCKRCDKAVSGLGKDELPNSFIGPTAKSLAVWLKYDIKMSDRDLKRLFEQLFHLTIDPSSVPGFRNQLARHTTDVYDKLKEELRKSKQAYVDETGWKLNGDRYQLWSGSNDRVSVFMIHKSRGLKALQELMGERFDGTLISDFYSVYDKFAATFHQRCNVHLIRELKKILKSWPDDEPTQTYGKKLKTWAQDALALKRDWMNNVFSQDVFEDRRRQIKNQMSQFQFPNPDRKPLLRMAKRMEKYKDKLLTFLDDPAVEGHNNRAERQIRPNVIFRKLTFGNRSVQGTLNHSMFMSLIQTAKLNDKSPPEALFNLWTLPNNNLSLNFLGL
jgi:transposase